RVGDVCLVERTNLATGSGVHWEVVVLRHDPARTFPDGRAVPAREAYPSPEAWGTASWTYTALPEARARVAALDEKAGFSLRRSPQSLADPGSGPFPVPGAAAGVEDEP